MNRLDGKTALLIGEDPVTLAIAARYAAEGAAVTLIGNGLPAGISASAGVNAIESGPANTDAEREMIRKAAGRALDILLLGGADIPAEQDWIPVSKLSIDQLRKAEDRLVIRALTALQASEVALRAAGNSSVIFVHSPAGIFSEGGWADYTICYHARTGLMRAVAAEWGPVRANLLVPFADTPGFRAFRERNPAEVDHRTSVTAMKRPGDLVKDIGGAAVFLGSSDSQYVTGMTVPADGGASLTIPVVETQMESAR
jgi:NAD(P)-dependent dehydrogenase (short-subunit alcohol dehydrogenase family)